MIKFRSKFEADFAGNLKLHDVKVIYEKSVVKYLIPESIHKYTPDFMIGHFALETKGVLKIGDRKKMILVKAQHPELEFVLIFQNAKNKIAKGSKTTYGMWADANGFEWYNKIIPKERLKEMQRTEVKI